MPPIAPLQLTPLQQLGAIIGALGLLAFIVLLIYRRRLGENYASLWFAVGVLILIATIWQDGLRFIARALDAVTLTAPLFLLSIVFLTVIAIHVSTKLTEHGQRIKSLAQEVALLRSQLDDAERGDGKRDPSA